MLVSMVGHIHRIILTLSLIVYSHSLPAQPAAIQTIHYTKATGLPHQHVYQTFQDSRNMIWVVTGSGLCFLNGNRFTTVMHWPVDHNTINVRLRFEDKSGNLWIRTHNNNLQASFRLFNILLMKEIPLSSVVNPSIIPDLYDAGKYEQGHYVFVSNQGAVTIQQPNGEYKRIWNSPNGRIMLGTPQQNNTRICLISHEPRVSPSWLTLIDHNGALIYSRKNFKLYDIQYLPDDTILFSDFKHFLKIARDGSETILPINTYLPAYANKNLIDWYSPAWHSKTQKMYYYHKGFLLTSSNHTNQAPLKLHTGNQLHVNHMLVSQDNITWMATAHGLFKIRPIPERFITFLQTNTNQVPNTPMLSCRGISGDEDGNTFFVAKNNIFKLPAGKKQPILLDKYPQESDLYDCAVDDGKLWVLMESFCGIDIKTGEKTSLADTISPFIGLNWSITPSKHRRWIAIQGQIFWLDKKTQSIHTFTAYNNYPLVRTADIYHFSPHHANAQQWWLSTNIGLYLLDEQHGIIGSYGDQAGMDHFLPAAQFRHLYCDPNGIYWIATNAGLIRWNQAELTFKRYDLTDGFPSDNLYAVLPDDYGFLWISTDNGLVQFQPTTGKLRYFTDDDGIAHNEFNRISFYKSSTGQLYFGGMNGITSFNPADFHQDFNQTIQSPLFLTKAYLLHRNATNTTDILPAINANTPIQVKHHDRHLYLAFAASDYLHQFQPVFEYTLDNNQQDWTPLEDNELYLAGLPRGSYTLHVRNKFGNGTYNNEILRISIRVLPPFYLSWWFLLLLTAILALTFFSFLQYRVRRLRNSQRQLRLEVERQTARINQDNIVLEQQASRLQQLVDEKTRFLANVAHELRTPLALISGASHKLLQLKQYNKETVQLSTLTERNAKQLLKMVNDMLYFASHNQTGIRIKSQPILLHQSLQPLIDDYSILAKQKKIKVSFSIPPNADRPVLTDPYYLNIIVGNILANAVKFTDNGGSININTEYHEQQATLSISDTGRGIHPNDLPHIFERFFQTQQPDAAIEGGTGIGLSLAHEFALQLHIQLAVNSQPGSGTTFNISIPLENSGGVSPTVQNLMPLPEYSPQPYSILLVEDNPDFRYLLDLYLAPHYQLIITEHAKAALHQLRNKALPDLIITDIMMPDMDGIQLIEQIKASHALSGIPIIAISARNDELIQQKIIRFGVDDYLIKPFGETELLSTVRHLLSKKTALPTVPITHITISAKDQAWLELLEKATFQSLSSPTIAVDMLADTMNMSRRTFYREAKRLTGLTPNAYIQEARLQQARHLLEAGWKEPIEVLVLSVGLKDPKYFAALYRERFGKSIHSYR